MFLRSKVPFKILSTALVAMCLLSSAAYAQDVLPRDNGVLPLHKSPRWRESEEHPLRIIAYALHPVGWVAREFLFRPLSAFASSTALTRSIMGYREPYDYREATCFSNSDEFPDCHAMAPYNSLVDANGNSLGVGSGYGDDQLGRQIYFPDINFEFDKSKLNNLGKARVKQIAELLKSVPSMNIVVEGHTDYKGTDKYNMKLGERRAAAVLAELQAHGVEPGRLSPISYGEGKPLFTEETDWARAANRRVQFSVMGEGEVAPAPQSELPEAKKE